MKHSILFSGILPLCPPYPNRYKRRQLVRLQHPDERPTPWVDVKELAGNSHCLLLHRDPTPMSQQGGQFLAHQQRRRANLSKAPRALLLLVDSPEPTEVLISFDLGVQWAMEDRPAVAKRVRLQLWSTGMD